MFWTTTSGSRSQSALMIDPMGSDFVTTRGPALFNIVKGTLDTLTVF
jgi:hypothetical protein